MILSGSAVQTKGFGCWLWSATKRLMAAWRSTFEDAALEAPLGEDGEETLDGVEPAAAAPAWISWTDLGSGTHIARALSASITRAGNW